MPTTLELLNKALEYKKAARWCSDLNLDPSTMSQARKRGKLSPTLAASIAIELGEDPIQWAAIAGIEGDSNKPLQEQLLKSIKNWRKL